MTESLRCNNLFHHLERLISQPLVLSLISLLKVNVCIFIMLFLFFFYFVEALYLFRNSLFSVIKFHRILGLVFLRLIKVKEIKANIQK